MPKNVFLFFFTWGLGRDIFLKQIKLGRLLRTSCVVMVGHGGKFKIDSEALIEQWLLWNLPSMYGIRYIHLHLFDFHGNITWSIYQSHGCYGNVIFQPWIMTGNETVSFTECDWNGGNLRFFSIVLKPTFLTPYLARRCGVPLFWDSEWLHSGKLT